MHKFLNILLTMPQGRDKVSPSEREGSFIPPLREFCLEKEDYIMKKFLTCLLVLAMVLSLAACGGNDSSSSGDTSGTDDSQTAGDTSGTDDSQTAGDTSGSGDSNDDGNTDGTYTTVTEGKLVMSTNASFPPYEMVDESGNIIGIDAESAAALAEKLGLELEIIDIDFDSALLAVQEGRSDMVLAGLSYREDRDEVMDFSTSYATGVQVVIVPDGSDIEDNDGLDGKMIGVQRGTTGHIYASDTPENGGYGEEHVLAYDNGALAVQAMINGQIDAVIIDNGPAQEYVKANPGIHILEGNWVLEDYCLAVNEGNSALLEVLNSALEELIENGTVQEIIDKYITAEQ